MLIFEVILVLVGVYVSELAKTTFSVSVGLSDMMPGASDLIIT